jgi:hypothetical protein
MKSDTGGSRISAEIGNVNESMVAVGSDIHMSSTIRREPPTAAEREELARLLGELRAQVHAQSPPEQQQAAVTKVAELEEALTQKEPDLDTMAAVRKWFIRKLPALAGAVSGVIVHPIVGKLVSVAGDAAVTEFKRRFGT